jgi:hypothetical protein
MTKLTSLRKRTLYIIGSLIALVASYVIAENTHSTQNTVTGLSIPEVFADVPTGDAGMSGDDSGDGN